MATPAHCIYCFENLSASLYDRDPLSLHEIETLYKEYQSQQGSSNASQDHSSAGAESGNKAKVDGGVGDTAPQSGSSSSISSTPSSTSGISSKQDGASSSATSVDSDSGSNTSAGSTSASQPSLLKKMLMNNQKAKESHPLFVTWNTITKSGGKALRGCIGTFEPLELEDGLQKYALIAAFEDHRFRQISKKELPTLSCAVTLLTDFEPGKDIYDWELGENGIRIAFRANGRRHSATFLPDVATEQGWDQEETLLNLIAKSGWSGRKNDWQKLDIELVRYRGKKISVDYEDYRKFREWVDVEDKA